MFEGTLQHHRHRKTSPRHSAGCWRTPNPWLPPGSSLGWQRSS